MWRIRRGGGARDEVGTVGSPTPMVGTSCLQEAAKSPAWGATCGRRDVCLRAGARAAFFVMAGAGPEDLTVYLVRPGFA